MPDTETDPTAILRSPVASKDMFEQAVRAVDAFRPLLPMLTAFARAYSRNKRIRVVMAPTGGTPSTDGKEIRLGPPIALGAKVKHDRSKCERRDERKQQICPACAAREDTLVVLFHELAHICMGTFAEIPEYERAEMMERAVKESGVKDAARYIERLEKMPYRVRSSYVAMSKVISPYLGFVVNCLEDARVNAETWKARPGTKHMFDAWITRVFEDGFYGNDGSYNRWDERPLNLQAMIGLFVRASKFSNTTGWFAPSVEEMLDSQPIQLLLWQFDTARGIQGTYQMSLKFLDELRAQGFCRTEEEARPEPAPEQPEESESPQDDSESGESDEASDNDTGSSEESSDDSTADGSESAGQSPSDDEGHESDGSEGSEDGDAASNDSDSGDSSGEDSDEAGDNLSATDASTDDGEADSAGGSDAPESDDESGEHGSESPEGDSTSEERTGDSSGSDGDDQDAPAGDGSQADDMDSADGSSSSGDANEPGGQSEAGADGEPADDLDDGDARGTEGSSGAPGEDGEPTGDADGLTDGDGLDYEPTGDQDSDQFRDGSGSDGAGSEEHAAEDDGEASEYDGDPYDTARRGTGDIEGGGLENPLPDGRAGDQGDDQGSSDGAGEDDGSEDGPGGDDKPLDRGTTIAVDLRDLEYGEPEDLEEDMRKFSGHTAEGTVDDGSDPDEVGMDKVLANEVDRAILQGMYFEAPSANVQELKINEYDKDHHHAEGWNGKSYWAAHSDMVVGRVLADIPESVLGRALMKTRAVFDDNKRNHKEAGKKAGRVNTRALYKVKVGDERLFSTKQKPGKKDYFVVIGGDVSGSTTGENLQLIKTSMMAQAELCARVGIEFEVWMHTADAKVDNYAEVRFSLEMYCIKTKDEPWDDKRRNRLHEMYPCSGNLDGHTLEFYRKRADASRATDKIIMYYTDGKMPAANHDEELEILQREIVTCKARGYVAMAVGIHTDSPIAHGFDTVQIDSIDEIIRVVEHLDKRLIRKAVA